MEIERRAPHVQTHYTPSLRWERINFNLDNEWLKNRRVRWATAYTLAREQIIHAVFEGRCEVAHNWPAPRHPAFSPRARRYLYDPARAMALLREKQDSPREPMGFSATGRGGGWG